MSPSASPQLSECFCPFGLHPCGYSIYRTLIQPGKLALAGYNRRLSLRSAPLGCTRLHTDVAFDLVAQSAAGRLCRRRVGQKRLRAEWRHIGVRTSKAVLRLPDLEQSKLAVLNSLRI